MDTILLKETALKETTVKDYKILRVDTGMEQSASVNSKITDLIVKKSQERIVGASVASRFLGKLRVEEINQELFDGICSQDSHRTESQNKAIEIANLLITELLEADVLVFNVPVYPFGVQKNFKAYLDVVLRCGRSRFELGADMKSKLSHKKVLLITNDVPLNDATCENYAQYLLKFLGITKSEVYSLARNTKSDDISVRSIVQEIDQELWV